MVGKRTQTRFHKRGDVLISPWKRIWVFDKWMLKGSPSRWQDLVVENVEQVWK